ncbi:MAG: RagB/SusD family nutrient uptake outer membrane protein [Rikenellaceae bacterium]|jgi:hypothetical protein|nr:RagB/SusD family nutrient uptake outer membrane protein [Rikenellaceae bacterium]
MKTSRIYPTAIAVIMLALTGCKDFLDTMPHDKPSAKAAWKDLAAATQYANSLYTTLDYFGQYGNAGTNIGLTDGLTDVMKFNSMQVLPNAGQPNNLALYNGVNADNASYQLGLWTNIYKRIAQVNEFLYTQKEYSALDAAINARLRSEALFFRGMLYFELIKRHKNVILYDEDMAKYQSNSPLSDEDSGWNMVENDLKAAAANLPWKYNAADAGRVTKGAAYALLSRAMLYAKRWEVAKVAADSVIELGAAHAGYALIAPVTTAADYRNIFSTTSSESVLWYAYVTATTGPNHSFDFSFAPKGDDARALGYGSPTQELVELYEKADGTGRPDWNQWHAAGGSMANPPYSLLEPRFGATVLYNGASWKGRTIQTYQGGNEGWAPFVLDASFPTGSTCTGYFICKLLDPAHNLGDGLKCTQPWIAIRLPEVYLNRAEACDRLNNATQANADVRAVRARVSLPYTDKSGTALTEAIRTERKIELAFEGQLYWDMRRWELAHTAYTGIRVHGFKITQESGGAFRYEYVDCDLRDRIFDQKLYRIPLPVTELDNNKAVSQFSEWL